ncbi:hypothetical protein Aperf_G00000117922 [Anoplocephala perfoliata]
MCADSNPEEFVQVDVSGDDDAHSNSDHSVPVPPNIPIASVVEPTDSSGTQIVQVPDRSTIDEVSNHHEDDDDDDSDSEFEDETIVERLIGLTEMFPCWFQNAASSTFTAVVSATKYAYSFSRGAAWFLASTATICLLPVMLEVERAQMEEQEASEHRSMMLGPGGAGGSGLAGFQANMPILSPISSK